MAASCGNLQRPLGRRLALDVGEVRQAALQLAHQCHRARQGLAFRLQRGDHIQQVPGLAHHQAVDEGGLGRTGFG